MTTIKIEKDFKPLYAGLTRGLRRFILDQGFQGRFLPDGDFLSLIEKTIGNMYGCFHMADHIKPPSACQETPLPLR